MLLSGIQVRPELDPRLKHSRVTPLDYARRYDLIPHRLLRFHLRSHVISPCFCRSTAGLGFLRPGFFLLCSAIQGEAPIPRLKIVRKLSSIRFHRAPTMPDLACAGLSSQSRRSWSRLRYECKFKDISGQTRPRMHGHWDNFVRMSTQMCNSAEWGPSSMHCSRVN